MKLGGIFGSIALITILLGLFIGMIGIGFCDKEITKKEVECYDKHDNEIIGEICMEESFHCSKPGFAGYSMLGLFITGFIAMICWMISISIEHFREKKVALQNNQEINSHQTKQGLGAKTLKPLLGEKSSLSRTNKIGDTLSNNEVKK